ncbi:glycosyltransferase [Adhaeribacter sp. BT258]|uniref:Glycosyltransferase n=1 Tax=Adhaeribacter terrigena TaxID=2793070 RepID=A0ABS1BX49_9BACT|nr:glycosyltransferase [Adhaeribacter terrigena]MBK0401719.1 glycosyltransferase [Adhaeribacter terrigena]
MGRLLHIVDTLERGGAETLVLNTVEMINKSFPDFEQYVAVMYRSGELEKQLPDNVKLINLNFRLTKLPKAIIQLRDIIKRNNIEVVHSHLIHSTLLARLALPKGVKLVTTYHSVFYDPEMVTYAKYELPIDKFTYKEQYFTIYVSDAVRENIASKVGIKKNFKVLPNFASVKFKPSYKLNSQKPLRIVMVGNLHEIKNHEIAIRALANLMEADITLDIYGDGILRGFLENLIAETGAKVNLKGKVSMDSGILGQYDLFLMTSHHEGMPLSVLEAMQTGLPSILNDIPMLKETAADSALYYKYDDLDALVAQIGKVYQNRSILADLAQKAVVRSRQFSAESYMNQLLEIYRS